MNFRPLFLLFVSLLSWSIAAAPNKCIEELVTQREYIESIVNYSSLENFKKNFPEFGLINSTDNIQLIRTAFEDQPENVRYFDGEIAILKILNDEVIKDKDLVTKLVNLHKILFIYYLTQPENSEIQNLLLNKYSDFKSLRFGFDFNTSDPIELKFTKLTPELINEMDMVFQKANSHFRDIIRLWGIAKEHNYDQRSLVAHPKRWFLMGSGPTIDSANITARWMRLHQHQGTLHIVHFENIENELEQLATSTEDLRQRTMGRLKELNPKLVTKIEGTNILIPTSNLLKIINKTKIKTASKKGLSKDQRDELRLKELRQYITDVRRRLVTNYQIPESQLTESLILLVRTYLSNADIFSPSIFVENRQEQHLDQAEGAILSVDFAGQNIKNLTQTLMALAKNHDKSILDILKATRDGEVAATIELRKSAQNLQEFLQTSFSENLTEYILSGDDGIAFFQKGFELKAITVLKYLDSLESPSSLRFTITKEGVKEEDRSIMVVNAENLEKQLRVQLEAYASVDDINATGLLIENLGTIPEETVFKVYATGNINKRVLQKCLKQSLQKLGYSEEIIKSSLVSRPSL